METMAIKSIFHLNINCTDHVKSKAFYEMLGFQSVFDIPEGSDSKMVKGLGLAEGSTAKASIMMLDPSDQRSCRLDLIEWTDPPTEGTAYPSLMHTGVARVALYTTSLDEDLERLSAEGVEFLSEPVVMGNTTRFVCFKDPDGVILELIEFPRGS
jgi:catechol 2,3-dioxygenase-like lactoylglutathione lyase family enzyme